jgi:hypothetical protein
MANEWGTFCLCGERVWLITSPFNCKNCSGKEVICYDFTHMTPVGILCEDCRSKEEPHKSISECSSCGSPKIRPFYRP